MDTSSKLDLPFLAGSQAQKHVTLNESLIILDALVQLVAIRQDVALPASPGEGDCILLSAALEGAGAAGDIAQFQDGAWRFYTPREGWRCFVLEESAERVFLNGSWERSVGDASTSQLGVSTSADDTNRLAVASPAALFTHAGAGHQLKVNKANEGETASLLFQSDWSGRAEMGLAGEDDFSIKVSADGSDWRTGLHISGATGRVSAPGGIAGTQPGANLLLNAGFQINQRGFVGGALAAGDYGYDRWRAASAGFNGQADGEAIAITTGGIEQVVDVALHPGDPFTVSAENMGTAPLQVTCFSQTVSLPAGGGRHAATFTVPDPAPPTIVLELSGHGAIAHRPKIEAGRVATAYTPRLRAEDASLCEAYYEQVGPGPGAWSPFGFCVAASPTILSGYISFKRKRVPPAISFEGDFQCLGVVNNHDHIASLTAFSVSPSGFELRAQLSVNVASGAAGVFRASNDASAMIILDAEHQV